MNETFNLHHRFAVSQSLNPKPSTLNPNTQTRSDPPEGAFDVPTNKNCEAKVPSSPHDPTNRLISKD